MNLITDLQDQLTHSAMMHSHLCPKQVIGVRMGRLACMQLEIDPFLPENRRKLFVFMEVGHCLADGVIAATKASPTKGFMKVLDYGKVAATFVDLRTGHAIRVSERADSRDIALDMMPPQMSRWQAQLEAYQIMPDELLLRWEEVELTMPLPELPGDPHKATCECCHETVHDDQEVIVSGMTLCKACAYGAYYKSINTLHASLE